MRILVLGSSTRSLAQSARRAGYAFFTLDVYGDRDQKAVCENYSIHRDLGGEERVEVLCDHASRMAYTHLVYGSGFENYPELVERLARGRTLLGNPPEILQQVRDWRIFSRRLKRLGIPFPESEVVGLKEGLEVLGQEPGRWLIKPLKGGGGRFICDGTQSPGLEDGEVLLQERLRGTPASASVVATGEEAWLVGTTEQLVGDGKRPYIYRGNIAPLTADREVLEAVEEASLAIAREFGLVGFNGLDFMIDGATPYVLEVNPRPTGAMEVLERAYGVNLFDLHVKGCMDRLDEVQIKPGGRFYGREVAFADGPVPFPEDVPGYMRDVPHPGEVVPTGSPLCTVLASGRTRQECLRLLKERGKRLKGLLDSTEVPMPASQNLFISAARRSER